MGRLLDEDDIIREVEKESNVDGAYGYMDTKSIIDLVKGLPSAQTEPSPEIQEILNYLDTTLVAIASPDTIKDEEPKFYPENWSEIL